MSSLAFILQNVQSVHRAWEEVVADLNEEQCHWQPPGRANSIAFLLWHIVRTEDNIVRFVLHRRPTLWMEGGWDKRFGLDSKAQGTGMGHEEAARVRLSPLGDFRTYMKQVFQEVEEYISRLPEGDLSRMVLVKPLGERPVESLLGNTLMTHGYSHLGEVWAIRGLLGLRGAPI